MLIVVAWSMAVYIFGNMATSLCYCASRHLVSRHIHQKDTLLIPLDVWNDAGVVTRHKKDEIGYAGRMFDINHMVVSGSSVMLIGTYDDFDSEVRGIVNHLLGMQDDGAPAENTRWHVWEAVLFTIVKWQCSPLQLSRSLFGWRDGHYRLLHMQVIYSPPDELFAMYI